MGARGPRKAYDGGDIAALYVRCCILDLMLLTGLSVAEIATLASVPLRTAKRDFPMRADLFAVPLDCQRAERYYAAFDAFTRVIGFRIDGISMPTRLSLLQQDKARNATIVGYALQGTPHVGRIRKGVAYDGKRRSSVYAIESMAASLKIYLAAKEPKLILPTQVRKAVGDHFRELRRRAFALGVALAAGKQNPDPLHGYVPGERARQLADAIPELKPKPDAKMLRRRLTALLRLYDQTFEVRRSLTTARSHDTGPLTKAEEALIYAVNRRKRCAC